MAVRPALGLALLVAAAIVGCAPPRQAGEIVVAPGAAARLAVAWRFGYAGVPPPDRAATTRVLSPGEALPPGRGERARPGDVLLENGSVSFVIAAADGTARGGAVVDAWSEVHPADELGAAHVVVGGQPVVARSVRGGTDAPTRAAWVDVVGTVDTAGGPIEVTTRYDVAPGVDGMLVHTSFTAPTSPLTDVAVGDVLVPAAGHPAHASALTGPPAALVVSGDAVAHVVLGIDGPSSTVDAARRQHGVPAASLVAAPGELVLHSRLFMVVPLPADLDVRSLQQRALARPDRRGVTPNGLPAP